MSFNSPVWFNVGVERSPPVLRLLHQLGPGLDELDHGPGQDRGDALQVRLGRRFEPFDPSIEQGEMSGRRHRFGPVSFMRGYDAFAARGQVGRKTRRAAKMVILDVNPPGHRGVHQLQAAGGEEAWALIEAGYDPSFTGEA